VYSLIIRRGKVYDGSGNPWFRGDVGVKGDTIATIGNLKGETADRAIDASDMAVAPGFIDIHTHSDTSLLVDSRGESHIRQGVTTGVTGNCGTSPAPLSDADFNRMAASFPPGFPWRWRTFAEYIDCVEKSGISMNIAPLVGHGTVRNAAMGYEDREPADAELEGMSTMVRQGMEAGCLGLSTGLIYTPGCYAKTGELIHLAKVAAEYDGLYFTHIRGENDTLLDAIAEAIRVGREAAIPVQIAHLKAMGTHMWGKSVDVLRMIDDARAEGLDVTFDQYPFAASATGLAATLPPWAQAGGRDKFLNRLIDSKERSRLRRDMEQGVDGWFSLLKGVGWDKILITGCRDATLIGKSVAQVAQERGKDGFETCFDILAASMGMVGIVFFNIGDEDLERILRHPAGMVGSDSSSSAVDGPLAAGKPHPRSYGTFARVLGHYARDKGVLPLQEAVRKMTSAPAQRLRLWERGLIRPGMKADLVVFDPETVGDKATYLDPFQYAEGIKLVVVNGRITVQDGRHTGEKAGRVLRRQAQAAASRGAHRPKHNER
jgi:N-acyl-D-aspartate/D-glutamate deacylase